MKEGRERQVLGMSIKRNAACSFLGHDSFLSSKHGEHINNQHSDYMLTYENQKINLQQPQ